MASPGPGYESLVIHISEAAPLVSARRSIVGLEAIALGTPVIMFVNGHIFSFTASSLNAVEQAVGSYRRRSVSGDRPKKQNCTKKTPIPEARRYWPEAVRTDVSRSRSGPGKNGFARLSMESWNMAGTPHN